MEVVKNFPNMCTLVGIADLLVSVARMRKHEDDTEKTNKIDDGITAMIIRFPWAIPARSDGPLLNLWNRILDTIAYYRWRKRLILS